MTNATLSVTNTTCNYINGQINVQVFTLETLLLDLLYTSTKPRRKAVFLTDERPRKVHHYVYTMQDVHRIPEAGGTPSTVHSFTLPFPELSDCFYYTNLLAGEPADTSPQGPIQAWRLPLTPLYIELWPTYPPDENWSTIENPPDATVTGTPGRVALATHGGPLGGAVISDSTVGRYPPAGPSARHLFCLFDPIYHNINNAIVPAFYIDNLIVEPDFSTFITAFMYGDISEDPCVFFPPYFVGNFNPNTGFLMCLDLQLNRPADLCGAPMPTWSDPRLYIQEITMGGFNPIATEPQDVAVLRPHAIYTQAGDFKYLGRRWPFIRPLLPQTSAPALTQKP